jgi:hypothetical protein
MAAIELHTEVPMPTDGMMAGMSIYCSCGEMCKSQYGFMKHRAEGLLAELERFQECSPESTADERCWLDLTHQLHHEGKVFHRIIQS